LVGDDIILLIPFQDPLNVGAVIRSAAAFGYRSIVLLEETATPFHPKSLRAAGSALFSVRLYRGPSIHDLSIIERPLIALSQNGEDISGFVFPKRFALLVGMEGPGLAGAGFHGATVSIAMEQGVESINASVAAAVAMYELRSRRFCQHDDKR
jgi:tRNA G18 (ribose-2'-O)-methylase SpoU